MTSNNEEKQPRWHAHMQICYPTPITQELMDDDPDFEKDGYKVGDHMATETMMGFDPRVKEDRKLLHDHLDEYLDAYVIPQLNELEKQDDKAKRPIGTQDYGFDLGELEVLKTLAETALRLNLMLPRQQDELRGALGTLNHNLERRNSSDAWFKVFADINYH